MENWKFNLKRYGNFACVTIPCFEEYNNLRHCFTTRLGGVSKKPYESLNLGRYTKDSIGNVRENYEVVCEKLGINFKDLVFIHQIHGDNIAIVGDDFITSDDPFSRVIEDTDAVITSKKNICLVTVHADCTPIFIFDCVRNVIALVHAGWRGTVKKIAKKTIERMQKEFNTKAEDCLVGIGPSIGGCCYEVDDVVINQFEKQFDDISKFTVKKEDGKYMLDLWKANRLSLVEAGVCDENITVSGICTKCNNDMFFSHRGENGITGRMASFIELV